MILFEGVCRWSRGSLAHTGDVIVTATSLRFDPSLLDRLVGAKSWAIDLGELTQVAPTGEAMTIDLFAADVVQRLAGKAVPEVEDAIRLALTTHPSKTAEPPALADEERLVLALPARLTRGPRNERAGVVSLTTHRLHFAHSGVDKLEGGPIGLDVTLDLLRDVHLDGDRVCAALEDETLVLTMPDSVALFAALCDVDEARPLAEGAFRAREATLVTPAPSARGRFASTRRLLRFAPETGEPIEIALADVSRVQLAPGRTDRLVVRQGKKVWVFGVANAEEELGEITRLLAALVLEGEPATDARGCYDDVGLDCVIRTWGAQLPGLTPGRVAIGGPAVMVFPKDGVQRGALLLFDQGLLFLPAGGPTGGERRFAAKLGVVSTDPSEETRARSARLRLHGSQALQVVPYGGAPFLDHFVPLLRRLSMEYIVEGSDRSRNRRNAYRAKTVEPVEVRVSGHFDRTDTGEEVGESTVDALLIDLSAEGCQIAVDAPLTGTCILEIESPTPEMPLSVRADIVRTAPPSLMVPEWRCGLRFVKMSPDEARKVREVSMEVQRQERALRREE